MVDAVAFFQVMGQRFFFIEGPSACRRCAAAVKEQGWHQIATVGADCQRSKMVHSDHDPEYFTLLLQVGDDRLHDTAVKILT